MLRHSPETVLREPRDRLCTSKEGCPAGTDTRDMRDAPREARREPAREEQIPLAAETLSFAMPDGCRGDRVTVSSHDVLYTYVVQPSREAEQPGVKHSLPEGPL